MLSKLFLFALLLPLSNGTGIGNTLMRTFFHLTSESLTASDAAKQGWLAQSATCDPNYGYMYAKSNTGPSRGNADMLWFTAGGQISAFGVRVWQKPQQAYIGKYWKITSYGDSWDMVISLRSDKGNMCNKNFQYTEVLGDSVAMGGISIPVTETAAQQAGFTRGACINGMGTHYALDTARKNGTMSWMLNNFYPLMPMYHPKTKAITGVLIASTNVNRLFPIGIWEGPFPTGIFCMNFCKNSGCDFRGAGLWSTLHWMFNDTKYNSCDGAVCHTP